jgi:hypothetical protein
MLVMDMKDTLMEIVSAKMVIILSATAVEFAHLLKFMMQLIESADLDVRQMKFGILLLELVDVFPHIILSEEFAHNVIQLIKFIIKNFNVVTVLMDIIKFQVKDAMEFALLFAALTKTGFKEDVFANQDIS